jgi:hypothetical protein
MLRLRRREQLFGVRLLCAGDVLPACSNPVPPGNTTTEVGAGQAPAAHPSVPRATAAGGAVPRQTAAGGAVPRVAAPSGVHRRAAAGGAGVPLRAGTPQAGAASLPTVGHALPAGAAASSVLPRPHLWLSRTHSRRAAQWRGPALRTNEPGELFAPRARGGTSVPGGRNAPHSHKRLACELRANKRAACGYWLYVLTISKGVRPWPIFLISPRR